MARPRTIDRDQILAIAEDLVAAHGAGALTIGGVAAAAGISKGGVQSSFGDKEGLISAMLERWIEADAPNYAEALQERTTFVDRMQAHAVTARRQDDASQARAASLLAALIQSPDHLVEFKRWFADRAGDLDVDTLADRRGRLAFLAIEGAFFLRFLGLYDFGPGVWDAVHRDIEALLLGDEASQAAASD